MVIEQLKEKNQRMADEFRERMKQSEGDLKLLKAELARRIAEKLPELSTYLECICDQKLMDEKWDKGSVYKVTELDRKNLQFTAKCVRNKHGKWHKKGRWLQVFHFDEDT